MPTLFDFAYLAATPVLLPPLLYRRFVLNKYRESLPGMLGRRLGESGMTESPAESTPNRKTSAVPHRAVTAWLHAVSVGETVAAGAVMRRLHERCPDWRFLASTVTETGQNKARQSLHHASEVFYYPLDFSWIVRRFFTHYQPDLCIIHETELWPNFLLEARRRGIPVFLANGKLRPRSVRHYAQVRAFLAKPFSAFSAFCMQTEADAERLRVLGVPEHRIHVTGNCKFDVPGDPLSESERIDWLRRLGWRDDASVVVAGSTHPGEEEVVLDGFLALRDRFPAARLLLAPRHPERFGAAAEMVEERGWSLWRVSRGDFNADEKGIKEGGPDVVLLDTIGQLARAYGLGRVALCAGSWSNIGGHNLLEAAVHAVPVVRGPNMQNQPEIVRILGPEQGGLMVESDQLGQCLIDLFENEERRVELGRRAAEAVEQNRGAAARTVEIILAALPECLRLPGEGHHDHGRHA